MSQKEIDIQLKSARDSIDRLEKIVNSTIDQINSQNNLTPIQPIKPLYLNSCRVRDCENNSWYGSHYIRFDVPRDCIKILNKKFSIFAQNKRISLNLNEERIYRKCNFGHRSWN